MAKPGPSPPFGRGYPNGGRRWHPIAAGRRARSVAALLAVQIHFGAVGVFEFDVDTGAVEGQRPALGFAMPQDPAFDFERASAGPASLGGIDAVKRRRAFAEYPIQAHQPRKSLNRMVLAGVGRDLPGRILVKEVQRETF